MMKTRRSLVTKLRYFMPHELRAPLREYLSIPDFFKVDFYIKKAFKAHHRCKNDSEHFFGEVNGFEVMNN